MSGSSSAGRTFPLRGTNVKKITLPRQQAWPEPGGGRAVGHDMALPEVMEEGNKAISAPNTCTGDKNIVTH